ncbi:MAG TPA: hypothetical protein P5555_08380 [Candidatus Paceibacterota bacterium]|nr:hypothetical protein [Verrucomicrobiota bacterium]HRZ45188.1 hypothetical protein [Candidatus Paceibacterota bacterium]HRZ93276.1 hypothetical protein [Candidatus Paceibacterota bacterium]
MQPNSLLNRRDFLAQTMLAAGGAGLAAHAAGPEGAAAPPPASGLAAAMPRGRIGKLEVSRLISGGNLISGWAHARDLGYVASLMRSYNTDEKVLDTLELLEQHGINTIICDPRERPMMLFSRYWKERGGKIQWIAEGHPKDDDLKTNLQQSIDFGASAVYVQGVIGDRWLRGGKLDRLGQCVQHIQSQGVPGGIGAHLIDVIVQSEKSGYGADFYVKTHHHSQYWSARRPDQQEDVIDNAADNYWDMEPDRTAAVMRNVAKPWIAFKTLAAGAIRPDSGFRFALKNGADFLCVGMFDFQVAQDAKLAIDLVRVFQKRDRPWIA